MVVTGVICVKKAHSMPYRDKERNPKINVLILAVIAIIALLLSILVYYFSTVTSNKILDIASQEVRSNTVIETHHISQILANKLQTVGALLQTLAQSPPIHNNEYKIAYIVINARQQPSSDLTDFYMWLNKDGRINWISNINESIYQKYRGTDLSYRAYFTSPKYTHTAFYSSLIESIDKVHRLYVSYPVINSTRTTNGNGTFTGVVVAAIRLETLGNFLKNQLFSPFKSTVGLLDRNGTILYDAGATQYTGANVFENEYQSVFSHLDPHDFNLLDDLIKKSLQGTTGSGDFLVNGKLNTIVYEPVVVNGKNFLTLYISAQHKLATDVSALIDQQKYFITLRVTIIGIVAFIIAFLVFSWNKRLENVVKVRTAELREANEQLRIRDKMQQDFINIAAHELRTPIQPILGLTGSLRSQITDTKQQALLEIIIRNAKRLKRLTDDMLDVSKIENQLLKLNKEKVDLNDILSNIVKDYRNQIIESKRRIKLLYDEYLPRVIVEADKDRITQVVSNLLSNAVRFTKDDGDILISVRTVESSNNLDTTYSESIKQKAVKTVIVSVKDTGVGIDAELSPNLFKKFTSKSFQGTGLGLFISKNIIEAHGGKIWAENNPDGKGATFTFTLPIREEKFS
ncbi:MAG: sensor histidine kinase [Candidatus Nitrosopolaris sp.]